MDIATLGISAEAALAKHGSLMAALRATIKGTAPIARFNTADDFYKSAGFTDDVVRFDHLTGINYEKSVFTKTYKKGTVLEQWSHLDEFGEPKLGNYYTLPGEDPSKLGIPLEGRVKTRIKLKEDTEFLQSTTQNIENWQKKGQYLERGGTQLFQTNVKKEVIR